MEELSVKLEQLRSFIRETGKDGVVIAYSGGVDSSTLAAVSHEVLGEKAVAVTAQSPTYGSEELADAKKTARQIGIKLYIIETDELSNEDFSRNPENRCYYCKKELLQSLIDFAHEVGFKTVFEGTNFSDLNDHRPGFKAVKEAKNVYSPWMVNKFTKGEIRHVAKTMGLSVHDKPALACLASRIPFNERITPEKLARIDKAEQAVKAITGVKQVRVRDHNGLARIEVGKTERTAFCKVDILDNVAESLKKLGFKYVAVDLEGYQSGSMLKTLDKQK
ncbi:MAG TPA: ATP-dependent sacrificial sulfur transferase LarE [Candidatus Limnocylindrales bacterium]|nr:ATP-dependent sacrificial sulfur transferase LarE [Candidatus Limnocylindrales bacterium]